MNKTVSSAAYITVKAAFYSMHGEYEERTTCEHGITEKLVTFTDGAQWHEVSMQRSIPCTLTVCGVEVSHSTRMTPVYQTEFWSDDDRQFSHYYYEL